jgi:homoserine dehydrogenase
MARRISVGLIGCGTVGSGVFRILKENGYLISQRLGCPLEITRVAVRDMADPRYVEVPIDMITTDAREVIRDPDVDIVVEVIGGIEPARSFILEAIENGKHVVCANKELVSTRGREILEAAERKGVDFAFEASVGGAIPIIMPLKYSLAGNSIREILGIVNGTTNYVLTRMSEDGIDFRQALAQAQERGYAEADPTNDVEGKDAAAKLAILASIAFNSRVTLDDVYTEGITRVTEADIRFASELGYAIKLLAIAKDEEDGISVRVHPTMIPFQHPLASVREENNAIFVSGDAAGELMFYGKGAGSLPAASAVVGDVITIARNLLARGRMVGCTCFRDRPIKPIEEIESRYFMIFDVPDRPGVLAKIAGVFGDNMVSIKSVIQHGTGEEARIVLVTHKVKEGRMRETVRGLEQLDVVERIVSLIRVEGEGED